MNKINVSIKALSLSGVLVIAISSATPALAVGQSAATNRNQATQATQPAQAQATASSKLDDAKKRLCEKSEARIEKMFKNINERSQSHLTVMNKISEKVQAFYNNKNLTASNYDELVAEVTRTQTQAQNALQVSTQTASQFGCDQDDPKGTANQYKVQVKAHIAAMKEYKNAINNLIVAVKTAVGATSSQEGQE